MNLEGIEMILSIGVYSKSGMPAIFHTPHETTDESELEAEQTIKTASSKCR
jgi:hypothetical protein